jgi:RNA polymerase sigma-70 factor (ECF subfamily)
MSTETEDLARLSRLDPQAISDLHDRSFPELYRYARYRLGDPALAEDTVSELFVRLLEALRSGKGPRSSSRGWLFGTLRHMIDDHFRSPGSRTNPESLQELFVDEDGPAETYEIRERKRLVRRALGELTEEQQHVLALRFGAGCSLEETAAVMERKVNAIKALQFRALRSLRRNLGDEVV